MNDSPLTTFFFHANSSSFTNMIRPQQQQLSLHHVGLKMEDTLQQEKQEVEYKDPNEDQGGFRRRLRDRALLKKRKAEAEEKETNHWVFGVENQRKRSKASDKSGTKKRGRPKKKDPFTEKPAIQEEPPFSQEGPAVVVVPEPVETKLESQSEPVLAPLDSAPVLGSFQSSVLAPLLCQSALINQIPAPVSPSVPNSAPVNLLDTALVQDPPLHVTIPVPSQDSVSAAAPAPPQVENLYTRMESQGGKGLDQVLIEDLGPDEEEDIPAKEDKMSDEDLTEATMVSALEQNKMFSISSFSSPTPPQEYLPGNSV